jgi:hypothetical protein
VRTTQGRIDIVTGAFNRKKVNDLIGQEELVNCSLIPQSGWLLSKHTTMCKLFCNPRIEISMPNNPYYHILKVSQVSPLARNNFQSWMFSE